QITNHTLIVIQPIPYDALEHLADMFENSRRLTERFRITMHDGAGVPQHFQHRCIAMLCKQLLLVLLIAHSDLPFSSHIAIALMLFQPHQEVDCYPEASPRKRKCQAMESSRHLHGKVSPLRST